MANALLLQAQSSPLSWKTCRNKANGFVQWPVGVFVEVRQGAIFDKVGGQLPFAQGWAPSPVLSVEITFLCHGLNATSELKLECGKENLQFLGYSAKQEIQFPDLQRSHVCTYAFCRLHQVSLKYFNDRFKLMSLLYSSSISKAT